MAPKVTPEGLRQATSLAFLIHPGYHYDSSEGQPKGLKICNLYLEKARKMKKNDLMILFSCFTPEQFRFRLEEGSETSKIILELRKILQRRLIIFTNRFDPVSGGRDIAFQGALKGLQTAKKIAKARGFDFNKDTPTTSQGEYANCCVAVGTNSLNAAGDFAEKTKLQIRSTDKAKAVSSTSNKKIKRSFRDNIGKPYRFTIKYDRKK